MSAHKQLKAFILEVKKVLMNFIKITSNKQQIILFKSRIMRDFNYQRNNFRGVVSVTDEIKAESSLR